MKVFSFITSAAFCIALFVFLLLLGLWPIGLAAIVIMLIVAAVQSRKEKNEKSCRKCKVKYDFFSDIAYRQIDRKVKTNKVTASTKPTDIYQYETYVVEFACTCPECQETKKYTKNIPGAKIQFNGDYSQGDPEIVIENYYLGKVDKKQTIKSYLLVWVLTIGLAFASLMGITQPTSVENHDPKDYYGTYYFFDQHQIISVDISSSSCQLTFDNIIGEDQTSSYSYEYKSANTHDAVDDKYEDCDAIIIYTSSDKSEGLVLWVVGHENQSYKFETNDGIAVTSEQITFDEITNDPKNYYGTYRYNDFYVTINEDGSSEMYLGNDTKTYSFIYMTKELVQASIEGNYSNNAIVLYSNDPSEGYYVFQIKDDNTLILANQYTFTK